MECIDKMASPIREILVSDKNLIKKYTPSYKGICHLALSLPAIPKLREEMANEEHSPDNNLISSYDRAWAIKFVSATRE